ncbi:YetF domain-containing protein [Siminovitchia sp. FSL W7-1587]|uniref:DUF421 domain-containing protein n=1 Tax=Siminovitchia sp. FSL W7-1587 TaxID=2954699 RepID=UPI0030D20F2D
MNAVFQAATILIAAILLLRLSGRKSIAQMTLPQTIVMLAVGTILVHPITDKGVVDTFVVIATFVVTLLLLEFLQVKINGFEKLLTGKSRIVIQDGVLNVAELKKLRMTVDQLEMRLRTSGIEKIEDVKTATIEPNGQLGYELMDDAKPLTAGEFKKWMEVYLQSNHSDLAPGQQTDNLFKEIQDNDKKNPKYLQ